MKDFSIDPVPSCHYILFSLTTPRRVSNFCDGIKKTENRAEKLHTYVTFWSHLCQKLAYCKKSRAWKISRGVPRERRKIVLSVPYILKIMSRSLWPHETVLQTSATKHPKSKRCKLLFGWCHCFRACHLITMEWNVKRTVPCKRWENFLSDISYISLCVNFAFKHTALWCILVWRHRKNFKLDSKSCILLQLFVVTCFRNWITAK